MGADKIAGSLRAISANKSIKSWPSACGTIWAHLKAQLVADWPPTPTHSWVFTHCPLWHSALWDFCWWKEQSALFRPLWLAGLNLGHGILGLLPVFSSPTLPLLPISLTFYIQITQLLSPPSLLPTVWCGCGCARVRVCVCGAAMEAIDR